MNIKQLTSFYVPELKNANGDIYQQSGYQIFGLGEDNLMYQYSYQLGAWVLHALLAHNVAPVEETAKEAA